MRKNRRLSANILAGQPAIERVAEQEGDMVQFEQDA
jgi:hypothetical protein